MPGDFDLDGTPRHGIFSWLVKTKNQWLLLAVHNVNKREPVPPAKKTSGNCYHFNKKSFLYPCKFLPIQNMRSFAVIF
jgi:hypothetical protein